MTTLASYCTKKVVKDLTDAELDKLREQVGKFTVEGDLRREVTMSIAPDRSRLLSRDPPSQDLPARGQRTRTNARTCKGLRKAIAGKKGWVKTWHKHQQRTNAVLPARKKVKKNVSEAICHVHAFQQHNHHHHRPSGQCRCRGRLRVAPAWAAQIDTVSPRRLPPKRLAKSPWNVA